MESLKSELRQFTGTELWYRNPLYTWMLYTEGVKFFADHAGAYWFLDIVGIEMHQLAKEEAFIHIKMIVVNESAEITVGDGNGTFDMYWADIPYTTCPEGVWEFYLTDNVLLLPSEY